MKSSIGLTLNEEGKTYTCGDTVEGVVRLDVVGGLDVQEIVVSFYGIAKTRNARSAQDFDASRNDGFRNDGFGNRNGFNDGFGDRYETREQSLFRIPVRVFPPDVATVSSYTLTDGEYEYPFALTVPFANSGGVGALPPSFLYERGIDDYAQVIYEVSAVVRTAQFYHSNLTRYQHIRFAPPNACLPYNRAHVQDSSGFFYPPACGAVSRVKYEPVHSATRSSWKRFFAVNSVKIPLELAIEFGQNDILPTSRALEINNNLASFFGVSLWCPFNGEALREILFTDNHDKGKHQIPENWPDRATISITHIKVTLVATVTYTAAQRDSVSYYNAVIVDKPLNYELELADFEPTNYYNTSARHGIFDKVDSKHKHLTDNVTAYKLPLEPSWFDGNIVDDITSSFSCPNIENDYTLGISLTVKSSPGDRKDTLRCYSNVVVLRNEPSQSFQPPPGPPPSHQNIQPPTGPPPSHQNIQPPTGPPPSKESIQSPSGPPPQQTSSKHPDDAQPPPPYQE